MARPHVRILSRYLVRQHLAPLAFALAALTALMLLNQVAKQFGHLVGKGLSLGVIAEVFLLSVPFIVAVTLPMAVLVAVLHAFTRLGQDSEITALQAGGIGLGQILRPVFAGAAVVSLLSMGWNDQVLPRTNHRLRTLLTDIQRKKPSFTLKEQVINEVVQGQFFLRAARIDAATSRLTDVTIYDLQDVERRRIIAADSGRMAFTPEGTDLYLILMHGEIHEIQRGEPGQFNRTFFTTNRLRVAGVGNIFGRTEDDDFRGDREMTICTMQQRIAEVRREADRAQRDGRRAVGRDLRRLAGLRVDSAGAADTMVPRPSPSLYCLLLGVFEPAEAAAQTPARPSGALITPGAALGEEQRIRLAAQRAAMFEVEIQKKLAIAAACVVFALVGIPIALRFPRGGTGLVLATSVAVFAIYYVGLIGGEELGDRLVVSPFLAMWTPNLAFAALGLAGLWLVNRTGTSPRGMSWGDTWRAVRRRRAWR